VSRVINAEPGVAPGTAARVRKAIAQLGYQPNLLARSLRVGRDNAIGLIVGSINDPFFAEVTAAVEETVQKRGCFVLIASSGESADREHQLVSGLLHRQVSGIIVVPSAQDQSYVEGRLGGVPIVFVDRPPSGMEADTVIVDNKDGARTGTSHLIAHGHTSIAFVGGPLGSYTACMRQAGFELALEQAGAEPRPDLVRNATMTVEDAEKEVAVLLGLSDPPTAIFAGNTRAALGVVKALHALGRTDVAMVSFDDFQTAEALVPAVTVIRQDASAIGHNAGELLFQRLDGDSRPPRCVSVPTTLVQRGSGELPFHRREA
jgi:LacI family transcriptional regulator